MGWKFSSSCHIDSSFSERNLPIMHTSSEKGPRMIIAGPQYTDPRSAGRTTEVPPPSFLQKHLDSQEAAITV